MSNNLEQDNKHFWTSIETLLWLIHTAKSEDHGEIRIQNVLERINSTMTRNSEVKQRENIARIEELESLRMNFDRIDVDNHAKGRIDELKEQL